MFCPVQAAEVQQLPQQTQVCVDMDTWLPSSLEELLLWSKVAAYRTASYLTDPLCNARDFIVQWQIVDELEPHPYIYSCLTYFFPEQGDDLSSLTKTLEKTYLAAGAILYSFLAPFTTPFGVLARSIVSNVEQESFTHYTTHTPEKEVSRNKNGDCTLTLALWNWCGIKGGYATGEGGQTSLWSPLLPEKETRLFRIVEQLREVYADIIVGNEAFDETDQVYIRTHLKDLYAHFIDNVGMRTIGPNSGLFIASKHPIDQVSFTPFPKESLTGGAVYSEKGYLQLRLRGIGTLVTTHLQYSEEPEHHIPQCISAKEEIRCRKEEMQMIWDRVIAPLSQEETIILAGDLNMSDEEFQTSCQNIYNAFHKTTTYEGKKTWEGDARYVQFTNGDSFLFGENPHPRTPSGAVNLDHILVRRGTIETTLQEAANYNPSQFSRASNSDHELLLGTITIPHKNK